MPRFLGFAMARRCHVSEPGAEAGSTGGGTSAADQLPLRSRIRFEDPNSVDENRLGANHYHDKHNR